MKKAIKIIAVGIALALICGILYFASACLGNPISYALAYFNVHQYLQETYLNTDYKLEGVNYDFKFGQYIVYVESPSKRDEHFRVTTNGWGEILQDNYETRIKEKGNTESRLNATYMDLVKDTFPQSEGYPAYMYNRLIFMDERMIDENYTPHENAYTIDDLVLNETEYVKEMGSYNGHIELHLSLEDTSAENLASWLLKTKKLADEKGFTFYTISVSLARTGSYISDTDVCYFLYTDIYEEGLTQRVEEAIEKADAYWAEMEEKKEEELGV